MPERPVRSGGWDDPEHDAAVRPLTRAEAQAWRARHPQVPAWWVVAAQAAVGAVVAMLAWLIADDRAVWASALYGAAVVKIAVSVLMLVLAPKIVQPLSWPALLASLVVCMHVYLLALLWRRPEKKQSGT